MRGIIGGASRPSGAFLFALIIFLFIFLNIRWVWIYRHNDLLDIDEAGYFCYSVIDYYGGHFGGLSGWLKAVNVPSIQAPLLTAVTSVAFLIFGLHPIWGFVTTVGFAALAVGVAACIGTTLRSSLTGLVAALLTACCPVIIEYARSFQFSTVATFTMALAVLAILRSRRFGHVGWAAVFGVALGLMPLSRTMTVAFVPGVLLASLVCILGESEGVLRRLVVFLASVGLAVAVAATWLATSGPLVFHYLFSFGYGKQASEYGQETSKFGPDAWAQSLHALVQDIHLPFFVVTCVATVIGLGLLMSRLRHSSLRRVLGEVFRSPAFVVLIVVAEQFSALTSSSNKGSGFFAPLIPLLAALIGYVFTALPLVRRHRGWTLAVVFAFAALLWLPSIQLIPVLSRQYVVSIPVLGVVSVSDGRGTLQSDEARAGYGKPHALVPIHRTQARAWGRLSDQVADYLSDHYGKNVEVIWGFRHELFNVNTVQLSNLIHRGSAFPQTMIDPVAVSESRSGYADWMRHSCPSECVLLISDRVTGDFQPLVSPVLMMEAAHESGFSQVKSWTAPDHQVISLWVSQSQGGNGSMNPH